MLGHVGVNVQHLAQAKAYYDSLMPLLDFEPYLSAADQFAYRPAGGKPGTYLFFYPALAGEGYSRHCPGLQHLAFMVKSRAAVHTVHAKVQELGSAVIHPPQEFPQYHPGYYAMFWQDPEGFMLEVVCHRDRGLKNAEWRTLPRQAASSMIPRPVKVRRIRLPETPFYD